MVITVTITDITQNARSISDLISNGSGKGFTVIPASRPQPTALTLINRVCYLSVQASPRNGNGTFIYKGDENVKNDGSCQAKELTPGTIDVDQSTYNSVHLGEIYLQGSANGVIANVEVHWA